MDEQKTDAERIAAIRRIMWPEKYMTAEEMKNLGLEADPITGVVQWDSDTLDAIAEALR